MSVDAGMQRVSIIGVTGSGKTTFAASLAARLKVLHVELDALHWEPNWKMAELEVFRSRVGSAVAGDSWVIDGNYNKVRDLVWSRADTVVWLDYALPVTFARLFKRTIVRVRTGQELWSGNRERFAEQFLSRDSLFLWALKTHLRYRTTIPALLATDTYSHLRLERFRAPRDARKWLETI
jgi:adenylate kinase family enzyme